MVLGVLERKNRDFFREVTLVVESPVTSKFTAKWGFRANVRPSSRPKRLFRPPDIPQLFLLRLMIGASRAGVKHIANFAVPA
jgi:hypothetical protein